MYRLNTPSGNMSNHGSPASINHLEGVFGIPSYTSYLGKNRFRFLNLSHKFKEIDWNFLGHGKLWAYNLNYFEFLLQDGMNKETGLSLIRDYLSKATERREGLEPYPISLRGINWIKFLSNHRIGDRDINALLFQDYCRLSKRLEYHLLGNHLLENGFSLLFGALYFRNEAFYLKARKILSKELKEQVLQDGGHFELSPMYHQILLYRLLDAYQFLKDNSWHSDELLPLLETTSRRMLGWLKAICWENDTTPMVNDAAPGIAPTTRDLFI